jgi:Carboxypeptidase regulatory-like domain
VNHTHIKRSSCGTRTFLTIALLCLTAPFLSGQTAGEITGEVKDPSGALTPGAAITATNMATNVTRSTVTNSSGIYSFPDMIPGTYQVKAAASGFETIIKTDIELQVQQTARIDFTLAVGQATQTVEVSASGELLATEGATVGTVIEEKRITELPLNGRSFFSLVQLSPAVSYGFGAPAQASNREGGSRAGLTISLAGSRATWSNYTLDGITNTDIDFNLYILLPSVDALQEFKVQTGIYPAEFGRELGQVNVSTKPGGNSYHGTAFDFLRNNVLDARPYDFLASSRNARNPSPVNQPFRQNQYGGTLSGPIWIPKIFNGKNRLFFMSNYEGFKSRTTGNSTATTLTARMRGGDFSVDANGVGVASPLQDPLTRTLQPNGQWTSTPFEGNIIPQSRFDKNSVFLMNRFTPLPNINQATTGLPLTNYQYVTSTPVNKDQLTERIDFTESSNSQWFGRYSWTDESTLSPGLTTDGNFLYTRASQWVLANTRILSPTKVNEARFGYNSLFNNVGQQLANKEDVDAEIGVPIKVTDPNSWGIPNISLSNNLSSFGNPTAQPFTINDKYFQGIDNFSWIVGKHSLRMGGEYRYNEFPQVGNEFPRGQFFFGNGGLYTATNSAPNAAGSVTQTGGYAGADFLLGNLNRVDIAVALAQADYRNSEWSTYFDDTWKVLPHLTITVGLRWEVAQPLLDKLGDEVNLQLNQALPYAANVQTNGPVLVRAGSGNFYDNLNFRYVPFQTGAPPVATARDGRLGARMINTDYNNFAPRFGIAYSPSEKWSFRTGFGIFFSQESKNSIFDMSRGLGGKGTVVPLFYTPPTLTYTNFISTASLPINVAAGNIWGTSPNLATAYTMDYLFDIQRTLGKWATIELGYNGSQSRKLEMLTDQDFPIPGNGPWITRAPYPEFSGIQYLSGDGVGNYNNFTGKLTERMGRNLTALFSYTWSKALDDQSAIRGTGNEFAPQNSHCRSCDYGPSTFNLPQRFTTSAIYTLPFGKGERFLNHGGVLDRVVGGWQISMIATIQSGAPIDTTSWDSAGTLFSPPSARLNCTGISPFLPNPTHDFYLNPAAFTNPLVGTLGNCGRNNFTGPHRVNFDFSTLKDFHVTETQSLQFRMEMFNAANHVELGGPNASWGNSNPAPAAPAASFGQDHSAATMRQIQFALKYNF